MKDYDKYNGMKRAGDWIGKKVISTRRVSNGWGAVPSGTPGTITGVTRGSLNVTFQCCDKCGFELHVSRVEYHAFKLQDPSEATK